MSGKKNNMNHSGQYYGGSIARFLNKPKTEPAMRSDVSLRASHPALHEGRTIFPSRVFEPNQRDRVLISGFQNAKIGRQILKGPWRGMPVFLLSLEERATCPRSCSVWAECYGNGQPLAVRFRYSADLIEAIEAELSAHADTFARFAVRLHVLGDFPDGEYLRHWELWMRVFPGLHVWGYTAHQRGTALGDAIIRLNDQFPGRWVFRTSVSPETTPAPWQATTTWNKPDRNGGGYHGAGGVVCPAETGGTLACVTCGLCWNPSSADLRIAFLGHGGRRAKVEVATDAKPPAQNLTVRNPPSSLPGERFTDIEAFIAARGVTRMPAAKAHGV